MKGIVLDIKDITDSREVMESKEPPKILWFIYIILVTIISSVIFAYFFEIDEYVKVMGEIKTLNATSSIMSSANCKLKEILVSEGQNVKEGDTLFVLDADYAVKQKEILEKKLYEYQTDIAGLELLKQSIEYGENLLKNNESDSKYYYRYKQYENSVQISLQEIDNSQLSNNLSAEEKENNLRSTKEIITSKNNELSEYRVLLNCVQDDRGYSGKSELVTAKYSEYESNRRKVILLSEQYKSVYESALLHNNEQSTEEKITLLQVEKAKQESDSGYAAMSSYQSAYLSNLDLQIQLLKDQLIGEPENSTLINTLTIYVELKKAVELGSTFSTDDVNLQNSYNQYIESYTSLADDYSSMTAKYQELYDSYALQDNVVVVTEENVNEAKRAYESAQLDIDVLKTSFVSQIQSQIRSLKEEIATLENSQSSLELSLKGIEDLVKYEKLSKEKLKNEVVITLNSEMDSLKENILSVKSQMAEISETIKNAEVKATFNGIITLVDELNEGDIVQAGNSLCSLIPIGGELKVMLYVPENEISKIQTGLNTEYIFDAIPYNEYGKVTGKILLISEDSVINESTGTKFYIAEADLSALSLQNSAGNVREVKTGMMVEAKATNGSKKAIVWLLQKINFMD